jgi:hypothetical protein
MRRNKYFSAWLLFLCNIMAFSFAVSQEILQDRSSTASASVSATISRDDWPLPEDSSRFIIFNTNPPNPFSPSTTTHFRISPADSVTLLLTDIYDCVIGVLFDGCLEEGGYLATLDMTGVKDGVYKIVCNTGGRTARKKIIVIR